ncbi:hypothetical protein HFO91_30835 [Rhizobium leguminosarum]|uniref:hypothetical protein n=1 Tax=Rhizobium leguminosarum TaxID=384 RepID=UPI001C986838|nr:hypothetical protein [Rhizobium leguminosarum]MBY5453977.1 hypothetical protein [Rhizobium leguminosarum]
MSEAPSNPKLSFAEENNAEVLHVRARDKEQGDAKVAGEMSIQKREAQEDFSNAVKAGLIETPTTLARKIERNEEAAARALGAKELRDANGTWAMTKSALASIRPEKPYVGAARATDAAAKASQPTQSNGP